MGVLSPGSYSGKGSLRMWDIAARQTLADLKGHRGSEILDASTGRSLLTLEGYTESNPSLRSISFSPDGALLASASVREIRLWDVATRTSAGTLGEHDGELRSVAFSPDGTALASAADDRTIRIWDVATGQRTATMEGHGGPGAVGLLFARWGLSRLRRRRPHDPDLGRGDGAGSLHPGGAQGGRSVGVVLARRDRPRLRIGGRDRPAVGRGDGSRYGHP